MLREASFARLLLQPFVAFVSYSFPPSQAGVADIGPRRFQKLTRLNRRTRLAISDDINDSILVVAQLVLTKCSL